jgi:hypothetical protein
LKKLVDAARGDKGGGIVYLPGRSETQMSGIARTGTIDAIGIGPGANSAKGQEGTHIMDDIICGVYDKRSRTSLLNRRTVRVGARIITRRDKQDEHTKRKRYEGADSSGRVSSQKLGHNK